MHETAKSQFQAFLPLQLSRYGKARSNDGTTFHLTGLGARLNLWRDTGVELIGCSIYLIIGVGFSLALSARAVRLFFDPLIVCSRLSSAHRVLSGLHYLQFIAET